MPALSYLCDDTRADWGAVSTSVNSVAIGEKDHFLTHHDGSARLYLADKSHSACLKRVKAVQAFHMGGSRGWADIGYNTLVCPHGRLIEGRGVLAVGAQCPGYNRAGVGSQCMVGGSDPLPAIMLNRQRQFYNTLVDLRNAGMSKMGHRDGVSTDCPGDALEKWVKAGMPIIGGTGGAGHPIPAPTPEPAPRSLVPYPGHQHWIDGPDDHHVEQIQKRITQLGYPLTADSHFGPKTESGVRWFQRTKGLSVDGYVGPHTWAALKIYNHA